MMTNKLSLYAAGAVLVLLLIYAAYSHGKTVGRETQQIAALDSAVTQNTETVMKDSVKVVVARKVSEAAVTLSERLHAGRDSLRVRVAVSGDSVQGQENPETARLITADDSVISQQSFTIKSLEITIASQDTLIRDLRIGIDTRDREIGTLKQMKMPRFGIKTGVAIGIGMALTVLHFAR